MNREGRVNVRVDVEVSEWLKALADAEGLDKSDIVRRILADAYKRREGEKRPRPTCARPARPTAPRACSPVPA